MLTQRGLSALPFLAGGDWVRVRDNCDWATIGRWAVRACDVPSPLQEETKALPGRPHVTPTRPSIDSPPRKASPARPGCNKPANIVSGPSLARSQAAIFKHGAFHWTPPCCIAARSATFRMTSSTLSSEEVESVKDL